ncbi:hypothetical protein [Gracilibacillus sp. JCM 18860]|uniref:hypothetical protein n=1 Tax=Gracilibacillus sp. JCM 18860 TaxID=1306159 RepID=UPI0006D0275F
MDKMANIIFKAFSILSLTISGSLLLLFVNTFVDVIPLRQFIQGIPIILPAFVAPFGVLFGFVGYLNMRNKLGLYGILSNIFMFLLPFIYIMGGTLIFGP